MLQAASMSFKSAVFLYFYVHQAIIVTHMCELTKEIPKRIWMVEGSHSLVVLNNVCHTVAVVSERFSPASWLVE